MYSTVHYTRHDATVIDPNIRGKKIKQEFWNGNFETKNVGAFFCRKKMKREFSNKQFSNKNLEQEFWNRNFGTKIWHINFWQKSWKEEFWITKFETKNFPLGRKIDIDKAIDIAIRTRQAGADILDINTETGVAMRRSKRDIDIDSWSGYLFILATTLQSRLTSIYPSWLVRTVGRKNIWRVDGL